jgi:uncharacterized coiled-coil DUF342 family protein
VNNQRRKSIDAIIKSTDAFEVRMQELRSLIESLKEDATDLIAQIEEVRDEEQEYIDNMPESLQQSERYQNAEAAVSQLEDAISTLEEVDGFDAPELDTDSVITALDEAKA